MATRKKKIGDTTYECREINGEDGRLIQLRIYRAIAAALSSSRGFDLAALDERLRGFRIDPAAALSMISDADLVFLSDTCAKLTRVAPDNPGGAPVYVALEGIFKDFMGGPRAWHFFLWIGFCLEETFPFFSGALARVKAARESSKSDSPLAPTGSSGDSPQASA